MTPSFANPASTADIVWSDPGRAAFFAQWLSVTSAACQLDPATLRLSFATADVDKIREGVARLAQAL